MSDMKLIMENWRGYVTEAQKDDEAIAPIMDQAFDHLIKSLGKIEPKESEEEIDEVIGTAAVVGLALAAPQILEIIGETINWMGSRIKRLMGKTDVSDSTAFGNKFLDISEKIHHKYLSPIRFVVKRLFPDKDDEWNEKVANRLFHLIVAAFLVYAGASAFEAFVAASAGSGTTAIVTGVLESAMTAVKSNEIWEFLKGT